MRLKQELRLAALLHDIGHSIHSHTSEKVFGKIALIRSAMEELSSFVGKEKGAAEVISFCLTLTDSLSSLVTRTKQNLIGDDLQEIYIGEIDFRNIALMIVGRAAHPYLQFLGDIISSVLDADKLDYLLRDATNAGLPLRYDLDRYLFSVVLEKSYLADGVGELDNLYKSLGALGVERKPPNDFRTYHYFDTFRLKLPFSAMNIIEQIVVCKLMLYSYIYHHRKVRASEGLLKRMLDRTMESWVKNGEDDRKILERFLSMTDSSLCGDFSNEVDKAGLKEYWYRLVNRMIPREVYCLTGASAFGPEATLLANFLTDLQEREKRTFIVEKLEQRIGEELIKINSRLGINPSEALICAGVWVDIPDSPKFEDIHDMVFRGRGGGGGEPEVALTRLFPIGQWIQAYMYYRYPVRIFAFSEYLEEASEASKKAMQAVLNISGEDFYRRVRRVRS